MRYFNLTFSFFALAIIFSVAGCKNSSSGDKPKSSDININNDNDANDIIGFNNKFLQLTSNHKDFLRGVANYLEGAEKITETGSMFSLIKPLHISFNMYKVKDVPAAFGKEQTFMQKNYDAMNAHMDTVENTVEEIAKYISAEDYKDDKGAKLKGFEEKISQAVANYYTAREAVYGKLVAATDDAEAIVLKDHPLKTYILSSKKVLSATDVVFDELSKQYESQKWDEAKMQELYNKLEAAKKDLDGLQFRAPEPYKNKETYFDKFKSQVDVYLGSIRKFMRDSKDKGTIDEFAARPVENEYQSVIRSYNNFVD